MSPLISFWLSLKFVSPGLLQSFYHALSSGVSEKNSKFSFSYLRPLPSTRPWCLVPPVVEGSIQGTASLPHSMGKAERMGSPGSKFGFWGILVHPFLAIAYIQHTSFIRKTLSCLSWVDLSLFRQDSQLWADI